MSTNSSEQKTLVWEWPLRIWHWLLVLCIAGSLATGLSGDIGLMDWHLRLGYCAFGLLVFRLLWGFVGGIYSRWRNYQPRLVGILRHFQGKADVAAHTAPGVALVLLMLLAIAGQAITGLYTTDDIFIEGPMVRGADDELVATMSALHHRIYYLVIAAIVVHLSAHLVYALKGSTLPLSMFTGRKLLPAGYESTQSRVLWAMMTALVTLGLIFGAGEWLT